MKPSEIELQNLTKDTASCESASNVMPILPPSRKVPSHPFCHTLNTGPVEYYSLSLSLHTHLSLSRFEKEEREEKENNSCIMQVTTDLRGGSGDFSFTLEISPPCLSLSISLYRVMYQLFFLQWEEAAAAALQLSIAVFFRWQSYEDNGSHWIFVFTSKPTRATRFL